jgi:UDP:flavonoid glycosyltransferase YjiC (YdhE family)
MSRASWAAKLLALTERAEEAVSSKNLDEQMKVRQELREFMQNPEVPTDVLNIAKTFKEDLSAAIIDGSIKNIQARSAELRRLTTELGEITADVQNIRQVVVATTGRISEGMQQAMVALQEFQKIESQLKAKFNSAEDVETMEKLQTVFQSLKKTQEVVQNFKKEVIDKNKTA